MYAFEVSNRLKRVANRPIPRWEDMTDPPRVVAKTALYAEQYLNGAISADNLIDEEVLREMLGKTEQYIYAINIIEERLPLPDFDDESVGLDPGTDCFKFPRYLATMYAEVRKFRF